MTQLSYRQILVGQQTVGLLGLKELFDRLHAQGRTPRPDLASMLLQGVERENYVFPSARPLYEEALLREYRRQCKQQQEESQGTEKSARRLSPRNWRGMPRAQVPWYPNIYPDRCDGCGDCLAFCAYDVYDWDEASHKAIVVDPFNCLVGCDARARVCKRGAVRFPPREMLARLDR
jgi:NAD-dependent dihydropyrimidine dehydrogenase PreA subunit